LSNLKQDSVLILSDWGIKPQKFREIQSEWFAKRGVVNHIGDVFYVEDDIVKKVPLRRAIYIQDVLETFAHNTEAILRWHMS
jgi:hypothetical protein